MRLTIARIVVSVAMPWRQEACAAQIEAQRRLPTDLVHTLRSIGVFRMYVPRSHAGLEFDIASAMKIVTALSRIDSSIGWLAGIGSTAPLSQPACRATCSARCTATAPM
ncbi:acyl-CoA dehydrogenase family protein [Paraburkholderia rhizosphaerae]|uniref:acyl-CoA dehydrogenase family protein n=1 Tax=Paraburkholderia rhizosphaerae TaxID=480658 RepID=UPI0010651961|nr:acyl-CoA dehydrogenase family protein [Paraburkholderia rhizosphaerae]